MKQLIIIVMLLTATQAQAGTGTGLVTFVMPHAGDLVIFNTQGHTSKPACSAQGNQWALSLTTETGKAMFQTLLLAQLVGKPVLITGKHSCFALEREEPHWIKLD